MEAVLQGMLEKFLEKSEKRREVSELQPPWWRSANIKRDYHRHANSRRLRPLNKTISENDPRDKRANKAYYIVYRICKNEAVRNQSGMINCLCSLMKLITKDVVSPTRSVRGNFRRVDTQSSLQEFCQVPGLRVHSMHGFRKNPRISTCMSMIWCQSSIIHTSVDIHIDIQAGY